MNKIFKTLPFLSLTIFILSACNNQKKQTDDNLSFELNEKVFTLEFRPNHMFSGIYLDRSTEKEYIYFSDFTTAKKIVFLNKNNDFVKEISLKEVIANNGQIGDVSVISLDSILLLENYTNTLLLVNGHGEEINRINLLEKYGSAYKHELSSSIFSDFCYDLNENGLFLSNDLSPENDFGQTNRIAQLQSYYNTLAETPYLLQFKNPFDTNKVETIEHLQKFRRKYAPKNTFLFEFSYYNITSDYIFVSSWYSDKIFIYDHSKKEIFKELVIKSDFTDIGGTPFEITKENMQNMDALLRQRGSFNGMINRFFYDERNKRLFVQVFHEQKNLESDTYGSSRSWSLIIYDENFEKIFEKAFEHDEYSMGFTMLSNDGLYIKKQDKKQNEKNKKNKIKSFSFNVFKFDF